MSSLPTNKKDPGGNPRATHTDQYTPIAPEGITYLTIDEFAERFRLAPSSVRRHCANGIIAGAIKFEHIWRIPVKEES